MYQMECWHYAGKMTEKENGSIVQWVPMDGDVSQIKFSSQLTCDLMPVQSCS